MSVPRSSPLWKSFRLDAAADRLIRRAAKREGLTASAYIRRAAIRAAQADEAAARSQLRQARAIRAAGGEAGEDAA